MTKKKQYKRHIMNVCCWKKKSNFPCFLVAQIELVNSAKKNIYLFNFIFFIIKIQSQQYTKIEIEKVLLLVVFFFSRVHDTVT